MQRARLWMLIGASARIMRLNSRVTGLKGIVNAD